MLPYLHRWNLAKSQHESTPLDFLRHNISTPPVTVLQMSRCEVCVCAEVPTSSANNWKWGYYFSWGSCSRMALTLISNTFELCDATFYAYALPFNVVTNILRILTIIFHTEEGLYTRNVCVNRQFWHFSIIISWIINFIIYFQVSSVTNDFSVFY